MATPFNDESRNWRMIGLGIAAAVLWLLPLAVVALFRGQLFFSILALIFVQSSLMMLITGLCGVAGAWTIGGPGFIVNRAIIGLSMLVLILGATIWGFAWVGGPGGATWNPSMLAAVGTWVGLHYLGLLAVLAVARQCGWELTNSEAAPATAHQFRIRDLMIATVFAIIAFAVVGAVIPRDSGEERFFGSASRGAISSLYATLIFGVPLWLISGLGLCCGLGSLTTIGGGALGSAATATVTIFVTAAITRAPSRAWLEMLITVPAALVQYFFLVLCMMLMRDVLQEFEETPLPQQTAAEEDVLRID